MKTYLRAALFGLSALALAGCAALGITSATVTADSTTGVAALIAGYSVAATGEATYIALPTCSATVTALCSDPSVVSQMRADDQTAFNLLSPLATAAETDPATVPTAAETEAVQAAITALSNLIPSTTGATN